MKTAPRRSLCLAIGVTVAGLLLAGADAAAEVDLGPVTASGELEVGFQAIAGDTDSAKFDEYRDERHWVARGRFLVEDDAERYYLRGLFSDVGQDDEHYFLELGRYGLYGFEFEFDELPHYFSNNALSPYSGVSDGNLMLPDPLMLPDDLQRQDLDFRKLTGRAAAFYRPRPDLELTASYRLLDRHGTRFAGGLGSAASSLNFVDFASPVDDKTHEVISEARLSRDTWSATLNYTGSFYDNDIDGVRVDNPGFGSDEWQYAQAPDNSAHSVSLSGAFVLPTDFPARLAATAGYGVRLQDESFLPYTVNSALDSALPQGDLDGEVETFLGNVVLTARPMPDLHLKFHYRIYDYDNNSDHVTLSDVVLNDTSPAGARESLPNEYYRQNASAEASYRLSQRATLGFGWNWEQWHRGDGREVRRTNEQGPEASLKLRLASWAQLEARYAYATRRRTDYDTDAWAEETLGSPGQNEELRKFPQADRDLHDGSLLARFTPAENFDLTLSGGLRVADYERSELGLTDEETWYAGIDSGYSPWSWLELSAYYAFDHRLAKQRSTTGIEWSSRSRDRAHNAGFDASIALVPDRLDATLSYLFQKGRARTHSGGGPAVNYPTIEDTLRIYGASLSYRIDEHLRVNTWFRLEDWDHDDFQFDDLTPTASELYLANSVDDYRAYIYGLSLVYSF